MIHGYLKFFITDNRYVVKEDRSQLGIYDANSVNLIQTINVPEEISDLDISSDGNTILIGQNSGVGLILDVDTGSIRELKFKDCVFLRFINNDKYLFCAGYNNNIQIVDISSNASIEIDLKCECGIRFVKMDVKKQYCIFEDKSWGSACIYDISNHEAIYEKHSFIYKSLDFSPDGHRYAGVQADELIIWETVTGNKIEQINLNGHLDNYVHFVDKDNILICSGEKITMLNIKSGSLHEIGKMNFDIPDSVIRYTTLSNDRKTLAITSSSSNSSSTEIFFFSIQTGESTQKLELYHKQRHNINDTGSITF